MNFATWSIRNPIPSIVLFVLLSLAGMVGFNSLGIKEFPDLDLPTVSVQLRLPGAAPSQLETEVARPVEDALATVPGLRHLSTRITDGLVAITVELVLERPISDALVDVKDAIDRVRNDLPTDLEEPRVSKMNVQPGPPLATWAVTSPTMDEEALSWFIDDTVSRAVLAVPGIGEFSRVGGGTREVRVEVDPARLASLGVTAADVSRALRRVQQQSSGGRGQVGGAEQGVRTDATVSRAADLAALPIVLADGRRVRLEEVATVTDGLAERTQAALLDGRPSVGFQMRISKGADAVGAAAGVTRAIEALGKASPDLEFEMVSTTVDYTLEQYDASMEMLWEGALLAMAVVWLFLRNWRAMLLGAIALPLSIVPTFAVMHWAGFTLNAITLLALALVVGILVDDAIVEVENIERHVRMGKSVRRATEDAVTEIGLPVIATTLALVAVFVPIAFMSGIPGLVFKQFGWTTVAAVIASLLVARLVTPMAAVWLLKPARHAEAEADGPLTRRYIAAVRWCLAHRRRTVAGAALFFVASLALVPLIPAGFVAAVDRGATTVSIELPPGSTLATTLRVAEDARQALLDGDRPLPGIARFFTTVGEPQAGGGMGGMRAGEVRKGAITVSLAPRDSRPHQREIERAIRERLATVPGARFAVGGGGPGEKLSLIVSGRDASALRTASAAIETAMRAQPQLASVSSTASLERPEIVVRPDAARAAERGVTSSAIAETLRVATSGDFDAALAKLELEDRQLDIRVRVPEAVRADLQSIASLRVPGRGGLVPLDSIAEVSIRSGPAQIDRYDRNRNVAVSADLGGAPLGEAMRAVRAAPGVRDLPPGIALRNSGDAEMMAELFGGFGMAMVTGILCVYCVLLLLFRDPFQPVTILSAVPLSIGGAFVALLAFRSELGLSSLIGLVMLLGIVTKNSILLVEYAIVGIRERGLSETEALVEACRKRARPILMTTIAMVAGMLPLAFGFGGDASFRRPMAVSVIGGLITSTALSLLVVPVVFVYVSKFERRVRGLFAGGASQDAANQAVGTAPADGPAG